MHPTGFDTKKKKGNGNKFPSQLPWRTEGISLPTGWRIGKGEGFADLEYAMMASMGAVDENTIIVTTVHDCQVEHLPDMQHIWCSCRRFSECQIYSWCSLLLWAVYLNGGNNCRELKLCSRKDHTHCSFVQVTDIPDTLIENHDIVVDYIVTPTKVIECEHRKKPSGIIWSKITRDKLQQVWRFRLFQLFIVAWFGHHLPVKFGSS